MQYLLLVVLYASGPEPSITLSAGHTAIESPENALPVLSAKDAPILRKHMPEVDVLRGVAILLVVLYHGLYHSNAVSPSRIGQRFINLTVFGWLGVNLFFILSGFLITGILLSAKGRSGYFRHFYLRRALRILPAYLALLVVLFILHQMSVRSTTVALLFLSNYPGAFHLVNWYFALWSLSVEEQFYLFWPAVVSHTRVRILTIVCIGLCVIEPVLRWLTFTGRLDLGNIHMATYLIADNLALGALAAIFARSRYGTLRNGMYAGLTLSLGGILFLIAGLPFGILHRTSVLGAVFQTTPWNLIFAGILLLALGSRAHIFGGLLTAPLRFLGYISYGLYLVHILVNSTYDQWVGQLTELPRRHMLQGAYTRLLLISAVSILIAWVSRRFYEERFLRIGTTPGR